MESNEERKKKLAAGKEKVSTLSRIYRISTSQIRTVFGTPTLLWETPSKLYIGDQEMEDGHIDIVLTSAHRIVTYVAQHILVWITQAVPLVSAVCLLSSF